MLSERDRWLVMNSKFIPLTLDEMRERGWDRLDFLIISGDGYVDHPSFGVAIIARLLESEGYRIGIVDQPDWRKKDDFLRLGVPKYGVLVSSGNLDSMVNHYTANLRRRSSDNYSPGGKIGRRPDRALIVYCNRVKEVFPGLPIIIGGVEASLRRFAHYDYWSDKVRRSILFDTRADYLVYGMGERAVLHIAEIITGEMGIERIKQLRGIAYISSFLPDGNEIVEIPSYEEVTSNSLKFAESFRKYSNEQDPVSGRIVVQKHGNRYLIQNPPSPPIDTKFMDRIYSLPYVRKYHPKYEKEGGIPAIKEVKFSITSVRGCLGSCSFCSISFHQGKHISRRSHESIIDEVNLLIKDSDFKGYIHDVGGPTANFMEPACGKQIRSGNCRNRECTAPTHCKKLTINHDYLVSLLRKLRKIKGIKKIFIRSGIRFDYIMADKDDSFFRELVRYHVSGQLKVAPEHISNRVLKIMRKPGGKVFRDFILKYKKLCREYGLKQYLVPYFISAHPGATLEDGVELAKFIHQFGVMPEQIQDFYPTPGTLSTAMYHSGIDPYSKRKIHVPKGRERKLHRALIQYRKSENYRYVKEALIKTGNVKLIGYGKNCLIRPFRGKKGKNR